MQKKNSINQKNKSDRSSTRATYYLRSMFSRNTQQALRGFVRMRLVGWFGSRGFRRVKAVAIAASSNHILMQAVFKGASLTPLTFSVNTLFCKRAYT